MEITPQLIKVVAPGCNDPETVAQKMNQFLPELGFTTPRRVLHFLAQVAHESELNPIPENLNYSTASLMRVFGKYFPTVALANQYARQPEKIANRVYANRMGNGPESSGDGWKYRGRGLLQLTGKSNYIAYGNQLGYDLVGDPDLALQIGIGVLIAGTYFVNRGLIKFCDVDDIVAVTRGVNGGTNGLDDRKLRYNRAVRYFTPFITK
jgi:putative chitinase